MLNREETLESLNREVAAVADKIAGQREVVDKIVRQGRDPSQARSILAALTELFRRRLRYRSLVATPVSTQNRGHEGAENRGNSLPGE
jgi:hypothetical protein